MQKASAKLQEIVRNVVEPMGYELVGVEYLTGYQGGNLLRIYIDKENGIDVDDCAAVSHQLSGVLDVEDPLPGQYSLEVSSPGLDRPLFDSADFERFVGRKVNVRLDASIGGRRKYKGQLLGVEDDQILVEVDGEVYPLFMDQIQEARLVPEF
ncbi:ribosome maturation factor RimP [Thiolapillus sp.]|uniref:Ribosome maturation factor RimP n=1 Tax=Thiolapillus brandeum TaxID=1076588 RepID=A0A831S0R9_9GAMM|nr:ribosome maturation factor RimP [Thiolapillus sp.]HEC07808.1 ribosome maturation factor RimP [Thiolapillus brandeum]